MAILPHYHLVPVAAILPPHFLTHLAAILPYHHLALHHLAPLAAILPYGGHLVLMAATSPHGPAAGQTHEAWKSRTRRSAVCRRKTCGRLVYLLALSANA